MANAAINGLGRIGRATLKILMDSRELDLVAVNDIAPLDNLVYLLKYDTVYGVYQRAVEMESENLIRIGGTEIRVFSEKDPANLPWRDLDIDIVFECSGVFTDKQGMEKHLRAGAGHVILSAPAKGEGVPTVVPGVNELDPAEPLRSCASCTTNSLAPVAEIMHRRVGVKKAIMTTIHAYTSSQELVDSPSKKVRRGRAGAQNIVPTTTGAAKATSKTLPQYEGIFDGTSLRVPVPCGSVSDIIFLTDRETSVEELADIFREEASSDRYKEALAVTDDEIVSSDVIMNSHGAVVDLTTLQVVAGDLVKVMSWYDNEWGYSSQMVREAERMARSLAGAAV